MIRTEIPGAERRLPYYEECISTGEAMHEDIYFSVLEVFKHRAGRPVDDRKTRPGQIVPDIHYTDGEPRARVALEPFGAAEPAQAAVPLETADRPLSLEQAHAELAAIGGRPILGDLTAGPRGPRDLPRRDAPGDRGDRRPACERDLRGRRGASSGAPARRGRPVRISR